MLDPGQSALFVDGPRGGFADIAVCAPALERELLAAGERDPVSLAAARVPDLRYYAIVDGIREIFARCPGLDPAPPPVRPPPPPPPPKPASPKLLLVPA